MSKTNAQRAKDLVALMDKINDHKSIHTAIEHCSEAGKNFISSDRKGVPKELSELITELQMKLDEELISSEGQHSDVYFALKSIPDVYIKVLEQDNFGPLCVGIKHILGNWWVTYG